MMKRKKKINPPEKRDNSIGNKSNHEAKELVEKCKDLPHLQKIKYDLKR